jgi:hypothetical protein
LAVLISFQCLAPLGDEVSLTPESSPELTKRSWFGTLMGSERDETYTILVKGKPLASVKADLIHAFLSVSLTSAIIHFGHAGSVAPIWHSTPLVASFIDSVLVPSPPHVAG